MWLPGMQRCPSIVGKCRNSTGTLLNECLCPLRQPLVNSLWQSKPWAPCQIRKIEVFACAGNAANVFPATAGKRSRHTSRHVRDARTVMHVGIAKLQFSLKLVAGGNVPGIPGACATRNFTYLVRGPLSKWPRIVSVSHKRFYINPCIRQHCCGPWIVWAIIATVLISSTYLHWKN